MAEQPTIWLKKVWEFNPTEWRAAGYSRNSNIGRLCEEHRDGDLILFMISSTSKHQHRDAGCLVALAEYEPKIVNMLNFVSEDVKQGGHNYDKNGKFRWPVALPLKRIWELTERPLFTKILPASYHEYKDRGQSHSIALSPDDAKVILSLQKGEAILC